MDGIFQASYKNRYSLTYTAKKVKADHFAYFPSYWFHVFSLLYTFPTPKTIAICHFKRGHSSKDTREDTGFSIGFAGMKAVTYQDLGFVSSIVYSEISGVHMIKPIN